MPFWPTAVVGEADIVKSVSASACHIGESKGVSPGQKALLHGTVFFLKVPKLLLISPCLQISSEEYLGQNKVLCSKKNK